MWPRVTTTGFKAPYQHQHIEHQLYNHLTILDIIVVWNGTNYRLNQSNLRVVRPYNYFCIILFVSSIIYLCFIYSPRIWQPFITLTRHTKCVKIWTTEVDSKVPLVYNYIFLSWTQRTNNLNCTYISIHGEKFLPTFLV